MNDGLMLGLEHSDVSFSPFQKRQDGKTFGWRGFQAIMTDSPVCPSVYSHFIHVYVCDGLFN